MTDWHDHKYGWVQGCIDSNGSIVATPSKNIEFHDETNSKGKRWRFSIGMQELVNVAPLTKKEDNNRKMLILNEDEYFSVVDWLVKNGYASEDLMPRPNNK